MEIGSYVVVNVTKLPHRRTPKVNLTFSGEILTKVSSMDSVKTFPKVIPLWIFVSAACSGSLILMLLVYILFRVSTVRSRWKISLISETRNVTFYNRMESRLLFGECINMTIFLKQFRNFLFCSADSSKGIVLRLMKGVVFSHQSTPLRLRRLNIWRIVIFVDINCFVVLIIIIMH